MVSTRYEEVLEGFGPDAFFGGQNITLRLLWEAHELVNTTFVVLPIMSNVDESLSLLIQEYDGKIKRFADILPQVGKASYQHHEGVWLLQCDYR